MRLPHTIETVSGLPFDYHNPEVTLSDVAHGLAHECRFARQTSRFYSVAEHSVLVARMVSHYEPRLGLAALWHDAHEAYVGDLPTPLKDLVGDGYKTVVAGIDEVVVSYLGLDEDSSLRHPLIKWADEEAMLFEASQLMLGQGWSFTRRLDHGLAEQCAPWSPLGWPPEMARDFFIQHHKAFETWDL